jgi:hypothetical protein
MNNVLFTNVRILDGSGTVAPYSGSVLVSGNRIAQVGRSRAARPPSSTAPAPR